ncbi:MAG: bacterioferritin-associated ferredoxin [Beijerinckiaceae bacterium]
MIVCSCNVITDSEIRASLQDETCPRTLAAVYRCLGCSPNCGRCCATVRMIIAEAAPERPGGAEPYGSADVDAERIDEAAALI